MSAPHNHRSASWIKLRLAEIVWSITPSCREVARLTSADMDRRLPVTTRLRLGLHRFFCEWCTRYDEQLGLLREAARQISAQPDDSDDAAVPSGARKRWKQSLREHRTCARNG